MTTLLTIRRKIATRKFIMRERWLVALLPLAMASVVILLLLVDLPRTVDWLALALIGVNIVIWGLPVLRQFKSGHPDFFHPLVLAAFSFGLPMIVIRGIYLALGGDSAALALTADPTYFLRLALVYMAVGWMAVLVGFYVPLGGSISRRLHLPGWLVSERRMKLFPIVVVFALGIVFNLMVIREGAFGSSLSEITGDLSLVSVLRPLSVMMSMAFFLILFGAARYRGKSQWRAATIGAGIVILGFTFVSGSRAALFSTMILATMAIFYARYARLELRRLIPFLVISVTALLIGVLVITQFRNMRVRIYGDLPVSIEETIALMGGALQYSGGLLFNEQASFIGTSLLDRFVGIDTLGVTLARAESLKSAERAAGINDNIFNDLVVMFVPRMLWPGKPLVGEFGLVFTRIYLESPYRSSNGPTIFGDLYRNFRFLGVPIGMFIVGLYLRILYGSLIQRGIHSPLGPLFYVSLYGTFNWEATYTPFITNGLRILFALVTMTALIYILGGLQSKRKKVLLGGHKIDRALGGR